MEHMTTAYKLFFIKKLLLITTTILTENSMNVKINLIMTGKR